MPIETQVTESAEDIQQQLADIKRQEEDLKKRAEVIAKMKTSPKKAVALEDLKADLEQLHVEITALDYSNQLEAILTEVKKLGPILIKVEGINGALSELLPAAPAQAQEEEEPAMQTIRRPKKETYGLVANVLSRFGFGPK